MTDPVAPRAALRRAFRDAGLFAGRARALAAACALLLLGGCDLFESGGGGGIKSAPFTTSQVIRPANVTSVTAGTGTVNITANVPEDSLAMGIVVIGSDDEWKFIEHAGLWVGTDQNITGPDGPVPLAFNQINGEPYPSTLNNEAVAVHFPNSGKKAKLDAGTYTFPVGAANSSTGALVVDTLSSFVYYKTETTQQPALKLNVFVLNGVSLSITSAAQAQADAEILGAVTVLKNVYGINEATGLNVAIGVQYLDDSAGSNCLATPGQIRNEAEQFCLLSSYPNPAVHDAMNIFVISSLEYIDPGGAGGGVIGLAAGIPGPFNLQGVATAGTLAEYQGDGVGTILGFTLAHEFGHYLGLFHTSQTNDSAKAIIGEDPIADTEVCKTSEVSVSIDECPDRQNLEFPFVSNNPDPDLSVGQGNVVKYNPGVTVP